jgi:tryptophan synthase alpha chain
MNRLERTLSEIKTAGSKALIPYLTAGDPSPAVTEKLIAVLAKSGADVIELGMPFSDSPADGPVLQAAAGRALNSGTVPDDLFTLISRFRQDFDTPVALLVYYNQLLRRGLEAFCRQAAAAGADALIIPDLTDEEAGPLDRAAAENGLINIRFLAPTTTEHRAERICKSAAGFIYCVTVTGVTGVRTGIDPAMASLVQKARQYTNLPLALGFGLATAAQAAQAAAIADAVIVGSALVSRLAGRAGLDEKCAEAVSFIRSLKEAICMGRAKDRLP